jgi:predicted GNAT family N-acyltransferase
MAIHIVAGHWSELQQDAQNIREQVFIIEQNIAPQDEWDELDAVSTHFVLYQDTQALATARLLADHSIGRVAVLQQARGQGLGQQLMQVVIDYAKQQGRDYVHLSSQVHARGFYQALGFVAQGEQYLDCNIPHIHMQLMF